MLKILFLLRTCDWLTLILDRQARQGYGQREFYSSATLRFGKLNPMTPEEARARLLGWEEAGKACEGPLALTKHKALANPLLTWYKTG